MSWVAALALAGLVAMPVASAGAAGAAPDLAGRLAGNTLSAVAFAARDASRGGGELDRLMFQAYLQPDGNALIRLWDTRLAAYAPAAWRRWSLSGSVLCLELPRVAPPRICADVHVWGPRIAGVGAAPYAMIDGDLKPGNTIAAPAR